MAPGTLRRPGLGSGIRSVVKFRVRPAAAPVASPAGPLDLGKYKSVACIHEQDAREIRFSTFDTGGAEMRRLIEKEAGGHGARRKRTQRV